MAKTLVEVRNPNDPGHIGDHELSARLLNELYGVAAYAPAAGGTVNPDIALGGVHEIALPAGAITVGPIVSSDSAAIQRYNPGQRLVLVLTQPAAGGATVTWDASWRRTTSGIDPRPNAVTTIEFVNDAAAGAAPQWRPSAVAPTSLESVRVWHTDTANPAVVVRGAAAQAANLTEWQGSSGAVVAKVDQVGSLQARLGSFAAGAATEVPLTAQGFASQTADLQRWLSSTAAVLAKVDAAGILTAAGLVTAGVLTVSGGGAHSVVGSLTETGQTLSRPSVASQVPQVMQGFASQTADLTQWQSSSAAVVAGVTPQGTFYGNNLMNLTQTGPFVGMDAASVRVQSAGNVANVPLLVRAMASQTGDLQQWQNSAAAVLSAVAASGDNSTVGVMQAGQLMSTGWLGGALSAKARSATDVAQVIRAFASQTADLTQWQNSAGSNMVRVTGFGSLYVRANAAQGVDAASDLHVNSSGTTEKPIVARGFAGQIGNLTEWQDSTGAVLARVTSAGEVVATNAHFTAPAVGNIPLIVDGMAGQTGDLTEWRTSVGTVVGKVKADAGLYMPYIKAGNPITQTFPGVASVEVNTSGAGNVGVVVQAVAGQTANLVESRNSAGTVLAKFQSDGTMSNQGIAVGPSGIFMISQGSDQGTSTLYSLNGTLRWRGSSNTITQLAPA